MTTDLKRGALNHPRMELFKDAKLLTKESMPTVTSSTSVSEGDDNVIAGQLNMVEGSSALKDKIVGLYFSASWCPASKEFTPLLIDLYDELERRKAPFEIVAVPCDKTKEAATEFFHSAHGDWMSVEFGDSIISELKEQFNVTAIPKLIVLRPDGSVITHKGRKDIQDKGVACFRVWINATNIKTTASFTSSFKEQ